MVGCVDKSDCDEVAWGAPSECVQVAGYGGGVCRLTLSNCPHDDGMLCVEDGHPTVGCESEQGTCRDSRTAVARDGSFCTMVGCTDVSDCTRVAWGAPTECVDVPYRGRVCRMTYSMCAAGEDFLCLAQGNVEVGCAPTGIDACLIGDTDGDGYPNGLDCNDADANVSPGALEVCNGVDDDCNGLLDDVAACGLDAGVADAGTDAGPDDGGAAEGGIDAGPGGAVDAGEVPTIVSLYPPGSPRTGETGQFSAIVDGEPTGYAWDFGGGATPNTSAAAYPSVTFGAPGSYTVSLTASNAAGSSATYSTAYTVAAAQSNAPVLGPLSQTGYLGATGATINFNVAATDAAGATWTWDFGTGATLYGSSAQYIAITLAAPGVHHGSVTATTAAGSGTLAFVFLVSASPIQPPAFQSFSVASAPLASVSPRAILLADGRPLVAYVAGSNPIAASVSATTTPTGSPSFTAHEVDLAPSAAPRALAAASVGGLPAIAYLVPEAGDLVLAVSVGTAAPAQTAHWARHEVARIAGGAASAVADVEMTTVSGRLVVAVLSDVGLQMVLAQTAVPAAGTDWALHLLDASGTVTDCALADINGPVVACLDGSGTLSYFASTVVPPTRASDWSTHTIETYAGMSAVSMTVMGASAAVSVSGTTIFGVDHVHRSLNSTPTSATDWETSQPTSAFGRSAIATLDGRLAIASILTSGPYSVPYVARTVVPDAILIEAWQFRQITGTLSNPLMGDAIGLADGRLAFCYVDTAGAGSVLFSQANALW